MPYPRGHYEETRAKIIRRARRLFNRFGFDRVSIDRIKADANLTRGAFYSYFDSKSDLYAEVLECFFTDPGWDNSWKRVHIDLTAVDIGPQIVRAYLSRQHLENIANSCPMVALPSDVARSGPSAKKAFERVFKAMVPSLERGLQSTAASRRTAAQAIAALWCWRHGDGTRGRRQCFCRRAAKGIHSGRAQTRRVGESRHSKTRLLRTASR